MCRTEKCNLLIILDRVRLIWTLRGFESHPLRHPHSIKKPAIRAGFFVAPISLFHGFGGFPDDQPAPVDPFPLEGLQYDVLELLGAVGLLEDGAGVPGVPDG